MIEYLKDNLALIEETLKPDAKVDLHLLFKRIHYSLYLIVNELEKIEKDDSTT